MCNPVAVVMGAGMVMSLVGGIQQQNAANKAARDERAIAEQNAVWDDYRADQALKLGAEDSQRQLAEGRKLTGLQRSTIGASNVTLSGSALAIVSEDAGQVAADAARIRANALNDAWGYRVNAYNQRQSGKMAVVNANNYARAQQVQMLGNLITTGANIYGGGNYGSQTPGTTGYGGSGASNHTIGTGPG